MDISQGLFVNRQSKIDRSKEMVFRCFSTLISFLDFATLAHVTSEKIRRKSQYLRVFEKIDLCVLCSFCFCWTARHHHDISSYSSSFFLLCISQSISWSERRISELLYFIIYQDSTRETELLTGFACLYETFFLFSLSLSRSRFLLLFVLLLVA